MLSAGERPQPPVTPAVASSKLLHAMPDIEPNTGSSALSTEPTDPSTLQHIWVVTGPAGSGKSTVGQGVRKELGIPFLEGDDYHTKSNRDKMTNGIPLNDEDRWDWLISLRKAAIDTLSPSESNNFHPPAGVVVACSALKQKYRDVMRVAAYGSPSVQIHFIYLRLSEEVLMQRIRNRQGHYMKSDMVRSQLQVLEEPKGEWDVITINVEGPPAQVQQHVSDAVRKKLENL